MKNVRVVGLGKLPSRLQKGWDARKSASGVVCEAVSVKPKVQ